MIKFKSLRLENFRSYEKLELDDIDKMGLTLISGDNGSGKSSIRSAIEYLLLDQTSDQLPLEELCRDGKEPCKIYGKLEMENGDIVEITKYRSYPKHGNKVELLINDDDKLTTSDRRLTQKNIEQVLGITETLVFSSNVFSQYSTSFVECGEKARKDLLYNFIDKETYDSLLQESELSYNNIETKLNDLNKTLETELIKLEETKEHLGSLTDAEQEHKDSIKTEIVELLKEKEALVEAKTDEQEAEIVKLEQSIIEIDKGKYGRLQTKLNLFSDKRDELNGDLRLCQSRLATIKNVKCPVLQIECDTLAKEKNAILETNEPVRKALTDEMQRLEDKSGKVRDRIAKIEEDISDNAKIRNSIDRKQDSVKNTQAYNAKLEIDREKLDNKIKTKAENMKTNKFSEMKADLESKEIALQKAIKETEKIIEKLKEDLKYPDFWKTGFSRTGIPSMKMDGLLSSIEETTNDYLSKIGTRMFVDIDAQSTLKSSKDIREKISYFVHHPEKSIKNYKSYSAGERQRVKLSDIFAFNALFGRLNILILDEVLELSLDNRGVSSVISLLKEKAKEVGSLIVISHETSVKDSFESVCKVEKVNGISKFRRG